MGEPSRARTYHQGSSYPPSAALPRAAWPTPAPPAATGDPIPLPLLAPADTAGLPETLGWWAAQGPSLAVTELERGELGAVLAATLGTPGTRGARGRPGAATAGGRRPIDLHVAVERVVGVPEGLYRYVPADHVLLPLGSGSYAPRLAEVAGCPTAQAGAAATVVLSGVFGRSAAKYAERAYRYVLLDAGHAACNLSLAAALLGLAAPWVARFDDVALAGLLGVDGHAGAPLLLVPLGRPVDPTGGAVAGAAPVDEPSLAPPMLAGTRRRPPDLAEWIHGGTSLRRVPGHAPLDRRPPRPGGSAAPQGIALPKPLRGGPLATALAQRRSRRRHGTGPLRAEVLASLCQAAVQPTAPNEPFGRLAPPRQLRVAVRAVEGVTPGVHAYDAHTHSLTLVAAGASAAALASAGLDQPHLASAAAVLAPWHRWSALDWPDGPRGYRYAAYDAGLAGELVYLQAAALDLAVCGVGAFWDLPFHAALQLDPAEAVLLYALAVGPRPS